MRILKSASCARSSCIARAWRCERLTPTNCVELLFDDVIWARKARQEHDAFVDLMRTEFGVDVMRVHELLQDVVSDPEGRAYILDRKLVPNEVGVGGAAELRAWMGEMDSATLTSPPDRRRDGGGAACGLPQAGLEKAYAGTDFVLPPLPNQLFTRDSSCWIYGGVTVNPMYWPARRKETLHLTAIYKLPPQVQGRRLQRSGGATPTWTTAAPPSRAAT